MYNKIKTDIKAAMIEKNKDKKDVLRSVTAKAQLDAKESKCEINDEIVIMSIKKELKQLNQTKEAIPNTTDLYKSTVYKIEVLENYLPKQMTREEVCLSVEKILSSGTYDTFGAQMKAVMAELKGKADNKLISEIVKGFNE